MRQVLGYPINDPNIYETYDYRNENTYSSNQVQNNLTEAEMKALYPDSYNIIYPLVCKACEANNEPISKSVVDKMTDDVYKLVERNETVVNIKIEAQNRENSHVSARQEMKRELTPKRTPIKTETRETRQPNNPLLRDLIRILILQRLFGGGAITPPRPMPPRPPFPPVGPGRPPFPGGRPPYGPGMNRMDIDYSEYL
ncbi:MAG: hypothetical protein V8R45_01260 [Clostridia bacterium]